MTHCYMGKPHTFSGNAIALDGKTWKLCSTCLMWDDITEPTIECVDDGSEENLDEPREWLSHNILL